MTRVYLCDLSHTIQGGLTSEFIPYGIGCIKSYYMHKGAYRDHVEIQLYQDPLLVLEAVIREFPSVIAFSNYSWNRNLSYKIAAEVKRRSPNSLVVFGGPNYPLDLKSRYLWLKEYSAIDLYVTGEGEEPFGGGLNSWHEDQNIEHLKSKGIVGVESISDTGEFNFCEKPARLRNLDDYPSPYVMGYLDEFLSSDKLIPLTETNRGCPFLCTFCEKGAPAWNAITRTSVSRFGQEIQYIAKRTKSSFLMLADNNFGIFKEDEEIGKLITQTYKQHNYPFQVYSATSKTRYDRVSRAITALEGRLPITLSVQSLDADVLNNIKRKNLPLEDMAKASDNTVGARSRSEMILALPGDTRKKHIDGLCHLMDIGISFLLDYSLILLDGSELNTIKSRNKWKFETKYRLNHRCYGHYQFEDITITAAEFEEIVTATDSLSFESYCDCREFYFAVALFYMDEINFELIETIKQLGVEPSTLIRHIHNNKRRMLSKELNELFRLFNQFTREELWLNLDDLNHAVDSSVADDLHGVGGFNVLFRLKAKALRYHVPDIHDVAFEAARELLGDAEWIQHRRYFSELKKYMKNKKADIFSSGKIYTDHYQYDFSKAEATRFSIIPMELSSQCTLTFSHDDEQKRLFDSFPSDQEGIARMLPKLSMPRMYRDVRIVDHAVTH